MLWYQSIPAWFQDLFPNLTWQLPGMDKTVYLTFDDGPHPEITPWVLDQLDRYNMKATFFCVGDNVRKYPEVKNMLTKRGHAVGNHTMHHIKGWGTSIQDYISDIEQCNALTSTPLFRPPYGRIKPSQARILRKEYRIIMWSLLSCDFDRKLDTVKALDGLLRKTRNGSIVVFHDSVKAEQNLKVLLPPYLQFLHDNGFNCATL